MNSNDPGINAVITLNNDLTISITTAVPIYIDTVQRLGGGITTIGELIGFTVDSAYGTTITGNQPVDLAQPKQILVSMQSVNDNEVAGSRRGSILFAVPILSGYGDVQHYQNTDTEYTRLSNPGANTLSLQLFDERLNALTSMTHSV
jgi:hypothetical protein